MFLGTVFSRCVAPWFLFLWNCGECDGCVACSPGMLREYLLVLEEKIV